MTNLSRARATLVQQLQHPDYLFSSTLAFIDTWFDYQASAFDNNGLRNAADQNQGSCKVLAMAQQCELSDEQALLCFGEHYRDVLASPDGDSHQNIRHLQQGGLHGVTFEHFPLTPKDGN